MKKERIVVAIGGNALKETPQGQLEAVREASKHIVNLDSDDRDILIVHGNGPQVGAIHLAFAKVHEIEAKIPEMPLVESIAMSQGYIGYHLQNALKNELRKRDRDREVVTVLTQVVVDERDKAFDHPTKPIGPFYTKEQTEGLEGNYIEDSGRGYRRVVASPYPIDIVEKKTIQGLLDQGVMVVSNGGGGIPVIWTEEGFQGIEGVIDKDNAAANLANLVDAQKLIILTGVDRVALNFGTPEEKWLDVLGIDEAKQYIEEGHFAPGSMLPKIEAALRFVESGSNRKAIITSLENAKEALEHDKGTVIVSR